MKHFSARRTSSVQTAQRYVAEKLRRAILEGELRGGHRLIQTELAHELNVSTTPVREALRELAAEGLVRMDAHRGAVVSQLDVEDVREIYAIRRQLEPLVIERAMERITPEQIARAESLAESMERETDYGRWAELNRSFHEVFMAACGWDRLAAMLKNLHESAAPYVAFASRVHRELMEHGNTDHRRILAAARSGRREDAIAAAVDHMDLTKSIIEEQTDGRR